MLSQNLDYTAGGKGLTGYIAYDDTRLDRRPTVLALHEGAGLGEHVRERARRLAGLGRRGRATSKARSWSDRPRRTPLADSAVPR